MDDTYSILSIGDVDGPLHHLNNIYPTIKLTMEVEEGGFLPSLIRRLARKEDGKLDITVYSKQTHTCLDGGQILSYSSLLYHCLLAHQALSLCMLKVACVSML